MRQHQICADDDGICMFCVVGDGLENDEKCPYENLLINNDCPKFICNYQCRECPPECEFLYKPGSKNTWAEEFIRGFKGHG